MDRRPQPVEAGEGLDQVAEALVAVGRAVRDAVRSARAADDDRVVRTEGGDDVFGVDERAEQALLAGLADVGRRWPGQLVTEGFDAPVAVGRDGESAGEGGAVLAGEAAVGAAGGPPPSGAGAPSPAADAPPWTYLADPVDGTRPYLAGLRSAWVLLGAGRQARTLEDLEVGVAVEIPTERAALGRVAWAVRGGPAAAVDDDLVGGGPARPVLLQPRASGDLARTFVTVVRLLPGGHGPIGAWADHHLAGLEVYDDLVPCTGSHLMAVASGASAAVFDPRPLLHPGSLASHPYDLAALVVYRAAGAVVEALPPGPLDAPIDTSTPVAYAAYANPTVADRLRPPAGFPGG